MMREAEAPLLTPGAHVIHIECRSEGGASEPWKAVREIVGQLATLPGADDAVVGSVHQLAALTDRSGLEELVDPFLDLFTSVGRATPVLLTLDDVERIDTDSWGLLKRVIRLRPASAILIVASLTSTSGGAREGGPADDIAAWCDKGWLTMRSLRPLSAAEVEAAVRLRGWRDDGFVRSLRDVLHTRAEGSPAAVLGLLDSLALAGVRPPPPGSSASPVPELPHLSELPFSDRLLRFHWGRLAELGSAAHEMLSLLGPMDAVRLETLVGAANSESETVHRVLTELVGADFVVSSSDGYRLAHPDYAKLGAERSPSPTPPEPSSGGDDGPMHATSPTPSELPSPPEPSSRPEPSSPWALEEPPTSPPVSEPSSPWAPEEPLTSPPASEPSSPWGPEEPLTSRPASEPPSPWGPAVVPPSSTPMPPRPPLPERPLTSATSGGSPPPTTDGLGDSLHPPDDPDGSTSDGGPSAATIESRAAFVQSPVMDSLEFDDHLPPPSRSSFPHGWCPQPPAYIAAALLITFVWILWRVFTRP